MPRLSNIFRRRKTPETTTDLVVTGRGDAFTSFSGDPYQNDIYRGAVHAIAQICGKFTLQPMATFSDGTTARADERLTRLLQVRPNRYQTAYAMLYQLYTMLYVKGNAYALIERNDRNQVAAIYPLHVTQARFMEDAAGTIFVAFMLANGKPFVTEYENVVHLRRHYNSSDVNADPNDAINAGVELADTQNQGIQASIRTAGQIKGIVKLKGSVAPSKMEEFKRQFEQTFLAPENSGGVIASDATFDYVPFEVRDNAVITPEDQEAVKTKIYDYLGVTEAIVNGSFDDKTFGAFEEATIEALALQTGLEFTCKVYGDNPHRRIECQTSRIRYIGTDSKNNLLRYAGPLGIFTINELRDVYGYAPIDGGDVRIQSLNYADTELIDQYQIAKSGQGIKSLGTGPKADVGEGAADG